MAKLVEQAGADLRYSRNCTSGPTVREGHEQGAGRLGGTAGAQADGVQTWAVGARLETAAKPGQSEVGSASSVRIAYVVDGAQ